MLDSISRILCRAAKADEFYKFIKHDLAKDLKQDNDTISQLLRSFNADPQDDMLKEKDADLVNPLQKLQS